MRSRRLAAVLLTAAIVGCAASAPHHYGQYNDLAPTVQPQRGERFPVHLTVSLGRPANVAIFLVVPGRATTLLFPADSTASEYLEAGTHVVETAAAKGALGDSSHLVRRPPSPQGITPMARNRGNGDFSSRDSLPSVFGQHGYLLMFASQQRIPYATLANRIAGLSVPIDDDDALNTVTKLIRERAQIAGPWAAYSTDFPP